jgi:glycosyltransferase involved in cell wall biosynthesis
MNSAILVNSATGQYRGVKNDPFSGMLVSIIVPCRNELHHIKQFIHSAINQCLENFTIEIIIADGNSNDGTREVLSGLTATDKRIRWIDNPRQIVSTGLNLCLAHALGDIVVRMDVHTQYATDYVLQCVRALESTGAMCVGGPWLAVGRTTHERAIAAAFQSSVGSGRATSRCVNYTGWVDTVYLGAWWRADLVELGGFDESLVRNQDDELALRIHRRGGRVWQSADIRSAYFPRASLTALYRQFRQYGYWKIPVIRKHRLPASLRHLVPFAFFSLLALLTMVTPFWPPAGVLIAFLTLLYALGLVVGTRKQRVAMGAGGLGWLTMAAVATMHFGYAAGFARAILDFWVFRNDERSAMSQLTR